MCACKCVSKTKGHDGPVGFGLTQSTERMNGIKPTSVIQLACGMEVCPLPSAGGDKKAGGRRGMGKTPTLCKHLNLLQNRIDFIVKCFVCIVNT